MVKWLETVLWTLSLQIKQTVCEADPSPPFNVKVKEHVELHLHFMAWHRADFILLYSRKCRKEYEGTEQK
jgi:hypothetical protein